MLLLLCTVGSTHSIIQNIRIIVRRLFRAKHNVRVLPTVLRFYGSTVLRFYGSTVLPFYGSTVLRFYGLEGVAFGYNKRLVQDWRT